MEQEITQNTPFTNENYHHVGVIVRDMEKTIEYLSALGIGLFGMPGGPQIIEVPFKGELHSRPVEWKVKISMARLDGTELEFLQPSGGESALQEFLDNHGEGIHHLGYLTDDLDGDIDKLVKQGVKILTIGKGARGGFAYFKTDVIGGIVTELRQR